jgi:hypothetical protein
VADESTGGVGVASSTPGGSGAAGGNATSFPAGGFFEPRIAVAAASTGALRVGVTGGFSRSAPQLVQKRDRPRSSAPQLVQ